MQRQKHGWFERVVKQQTTLHYLCYFAFQKTELFAAFLLACSPRREINPLKAETPLDLPTVTAERGGQARQHGLGREDGHVCAPPLTSSEVYIILQCPLGGRCSLEIDLYDLYAAELAARHCCLF